MIDNNKLLSRDRVATGRNVVTIKRNLIKIDSLLKERLVLVKVRQGILRQQEQNRMRRQREDNLESLQSTSVQTDTSNKSGNNLLKGLLAAIAGIVAIFSPQLIKLFNFLKRIAEPIKKMATITLKALSSFVTIGANMVSELTNKFPIEQLGADNITKTFSKFSSQLKLFVDVLVINSAINTVSSILSIFLPRRVKQLIMQDVAEEVIKKSGTTSAGKSISKKLAKDSVQQLTLEKFFKGETSRVVGGDDIGGGTTTKVKETFLPNKTYFADIDFQNADEFARKNNLLRFEDPRKINADGFLEGTKIRVEEIGFDVSRGGGGEFYFVKDTKAARKALNLPLVDTAADALARNAQQQLDDQEFREFFGDLESPESLKAQRDVAVDAAELDLINKINKQATKKNIFQRGLEGAIKFAKRTDKTMVDFATRQTSRVSKVIMSGPLKGLQEGAEGMLKRAVGETIGLIPFLGDLVGLLLDIYLFGEIPERAGYKAIGGILGGFVGALIGSIPVLIPFGGPFIGSIIGGIGGDILGGVVYDIVKGKQASVSKQDVGESTGKTAVKSTVKESAIKAGLITFGKGGFTGKGDSNRIAGLVHHNEQVFDQDTTLAVRQNAPGFFEDLNRAKGFESLEVLRNFASYEGTQTAMAQFIPIPIPMPRKEVPPVIDMATGEVREDLVSSYHYARG